VLKGLNAHIPAGSFVAVHGESGSGKTTFADLVVGLHRPTEGRILVDGFPLGELDLGSWRRCIGYVPQELLLFSESIFLNVTLGDPAYSREDAETALRLAGAWDFVRAKPGGLDHPMGDRGTMVSGGQRQRIALARALVGRPSLLILDEVTTALDPDTELAICNTLKSLTSQVTILAISHQEAMRNAASQVLVLRHGRMEAVEDGSRKALA
jgi:ATP-binding cassette subfamily C protein